MKSKKTNEQELLPSPCVRVPVIAVKRGAKSPIRAITDFIPLDGGAKMQVPSVQKCLESCSLALKSTLG